MAVWIQENFTIPDPDLVDPDPAWKLVMDPDLSQEIDPANKES